MSKRTFQNEAWEKEQRRLDRQFKIAAGALVAVIVSAFLTLAFSYGVM